MDQTYIKVSQVGPGVRAGVLPVPVNNGTVQDGRVFEVDPGGAVPQEPGITDSLREGKTIGQNGSRVRLPGGGLGNNQQLITTV